MTEPVPNFSGKLLLVYTSTSRQPAVLENVRFEMQGGRLFLLGRYPKTFEWLANVAAAVAWDEVVEYLLFDSLDDYEQRRMPVNPLGL
ncbi:MAG TPA: hypothetical protein VGI81_13675 [Tepidisphaeraceae bacterium]